MSLKTKIILLIIAVFIAIILFFIYVLTDKKKDVSTKPPYATIINKKLTAINDAIILDNEFNKFDKEYEKELHNIESIDTSQVAYILIPKGSVYQFKKAVQLNHAVSGSIHSYMLGEVVLANSSIKYKIIYCWGTFKTICITEPCNYWEHKKAPWQAEIDSTKYFDK